MYIEDDFDYIYFRKSNRYKHTYIHTYIFCAARTGLGDVRRVGEKVGDGIGRGVGSKGGRPRPELDAQVPRWHSFSFQCSNSMSHMMRSFHAPKTQC